MCMFDFDNESVSINYLQSIYYMRRMSANIDRENSVTTDDQILTLVTCIGNQPEKRLSVVAVKNE